MENLTGQELLVMCLLIAFIVMVVGLIFKTFIKLAISIALVVLCVGVGFGWLPEKLEEIKNGNTTINEVINGVSNDINADNLINSTGNVINGSIDYIDKNKETIVDSFMSLVRKLTVAIFGADTIQPLD